MILTQDIQFQIECLATELAEILMAEYGWDIHRALDELYSSTTFAKLNDPECGLLSRRSLYLPIPQIRNRNQQGCINKQSTPIM